MSQIILHHYPESPFSEKVRLLLGYKNQAYDAVTIPIIMPKPYLMPLTGGYRKTPVMQIGADIYCDSALICQLIDHLFPENSIYPVSSSASDIALANWTDTFFFRVSVAVAFQPRALVNNALFADEAAASAFMADRAQLSAGSTQLSMDFETALVYFHGHMKRLDNQLEASAFVGGQNPTIVDFSTYHCCWFIHNNEAIRDTLAPYGHVAAWMEVMASFGQGELTEIQGQTAVDIAREATPSSDSKAASNQFDGINVGDEVEVMPIDYGFQPVRGTLQLSSLEELVVRRVDQEAGELAVHFPRLGFQISSVPD